ncbi:MAG: hypothetical protein JF922_06855 [Candidatus Dormibacteraeota bacterium]|uniref:Uncharacterized protein n=1 Tax=Candidatus Nephthysia bennettiae TaxID=3127016 RepID=A0A934K0V4_9BACT|nr:hypothetical protein [Candidatus Dormibacteraeota bacterium]
MAGVVAWALKWLGVGAEALRLIKAVRGKPKRLAERKARLADIVGARAVLDILDQ